VCHSFYDTLFLKDIQLEPGAQTFVGRAPTDVPFEIGLSVKDGPVQKEVIRPDDSPEEINVVVDSSSIHIPA